MLEKARAQLRIAEEDARHAHDESRASALRINALESELDSLRAELATRIKEAESARQSCDEATKEVERRKVAEQTMREEIRSVEDRHAEEQRSAVEVRATPSHNHLNPQIHLTRLCRRMQERKEFLSRIATAESDRDSWRRQAEDTSSSLQLKSDSLFALRARLGVHRCAIEVGPVASMFHPLHP